MIAPRRPFFALLPALLFAALVGPAAASADTGAFAVQPRPGLPAVPLPAVASRLAVGDLVFIRVDARPFREVAQATGTWTNHVGIVVDTAGADPLVAESTFPLSRTTRFSRFAARSVDGRLAIARLDPDLPPDRRTAVRASAERRLGRPYDTGFDLHSRGEFCSRYVHEVLLESTGLSVGEPETFGALFARHPDANLRFWKLWYLGRIPWSRETITPAGVWSSPLLRTVFDGRVSPPGAESLTSRRG